MTSVTRHTVVTDPEVVSLRVDASLYFPNARFLEDRVNQAVAANPAVCHVAVYSINPDLARRALGTPRREYPVA
jgi:hypothetical protein